MALLLVIVFVVAPLVELAVIVQVATAVGTANTIGLILAVSIAGAWLAKREGLGVLRRMQATLDRGEMPGRELADGALILLAGALMIAPGFVSDGIAVLLLLPPTRALFRTALLAYVARRGTIAVTSRFGATTGASRTDSTVWDVDSWEEPPRSPVRGELGDHR